MDTSFVFTHSVDQPDYFTQILPFITLLIGAILTFIITLTIQKINTKSNKKTTKNYLIHSLETLFLSIEKQQTRTQEHINNLEQKPNNFPALVHVAGFNVKNINIISPKEMYDIFVTNKDNDKTTKAFHALSNTLEAFETNKDLLYKNDSDIGNDNREYIKKHNILFSQNNGGYEKRFA